MGIGVVLSPQIFILIIFTSAAELAAEVSDAIRTFAGAMDAFQAENTGVWSRSVWNLEPDFYGENEKLTGFQMYMVYVILRDFPL